MTSHFKPRETRADRVARCRTAQKDILKVCALCGLCGKLKNTVDLDTDDVVANIREIAYFSTFQCGAVEEIKYIAFAALHPNVDFTGATQ